MLRFRLRAPAMLPVLRLSVALPLMYHWWWVVMLHAALPSRLKWFHGHLPRSFYGLWVYLR